VGHPAHADRRHGAAVYLSLRQQPLYQARAEVVLKHQNLAAGLTGIQDFSTVYEDAARVAETQAKLANTQVVANRALSAVHVPDLTAGDLLAATVISTDPTSDLLFFQVTYKEPAKAAALATAYASEFIRYRKVLDTAALVAAKTELAGRIAELKKGAAALPSPSG
jgi:uncharacterized protein involved in exopolysaccharide biosynthesis